MDKNRRALTEALLRGDGLDNAAQEAVRDYLARLRQAVYPMELWEAPFVIAAAQALVSDIQSSVPGSREAAEVLREENKLEVVP